MKPGKIISYVMPVTLEEGLTKIGQHYEVNFENGIKVLNSRNTNYSFGSLHQIMLKGITEVLRKQQPKAVLMLGLGAGSALQILSRKCRELPAITVVEIDEDLIRIAGEHFGLNEYKDIRIINQDAFQSVRELPAASFDLIIDDIFWDNEIPEFCRRVDYLSSCAGLLSENGVYMRNTMDSDSFPFAEYETSLKEVFPVLDSLVHARFKNKIYFCRRRAAK